MFVGDGRTYLLIIVRVRITVVAVPKLDPAQGISLHTLLYGQEGLPHRNGFTEQTVIQALQRAGFAGVSVLSENIELWSRGEKPASDHGKSSLGRHEAPSAGADRANSAAGGWSGHYSEL